MRTEDAKAIAIRLHTSIDTIRMGLEQEKFPFGTAIKCNEQYVYILYPEKVKEYLGINI